MQQCVNRYQLQEKAEFAFNSWRKAGIAQESSECKDLILCSKNDRFHSTSEAEAGVASAPNSISGSVITSSNFCGVQGATISAVASSGNTFNAHNGILNSNTCPLIDSHSSGSSMLCGSFSRQGDSQTSSNSQSAQSSDNLGMIPGQPHKSEHQDCITWSLTSSADGPQGSTSKPMNPNSVGAKSAVSEPHSLQATTTQHSMSDLHPPHPDMQANVQKIESTQRYDIASSHSTSCIGSNFINSHGNGTYRNVGGNNGAHSNNTQLLPGGAAVDSNGSHNQNSFGAQYNSSANRAKNQVTGCENNSCSNNSNSPYSGWQSLNAAVSSSSSSSWNIPESNQTGRSCHVNVNQSNSSTSDNPINDVEEHMIIDNDIAYNGLIGATGGCEFTEENRQTGSNAYRDGSAPWGMNHPRMGLLGGGETSINSGSSAWGGQSSGGGSSTPGWGGNNRQQGGSTSSEVPGNANAENVDSEISYTGLVGATGGSDYMEGKQSGSFRQEPPRSIPPPRMGLLGGGESSLTSGPSGWGSSGTSVSGWGSGNRQNNSASEVTGNTSTGMSPPKPHNSWAQAAGKGLNPMPNTSVSSSQNSNSNVSSDSNAGQSNVLGSSTKPRGEEQMTELKVKAAFSEGWGQTTVNQESPWDVPLSPPAPPDSNGQKENSSTVWRQTVNNGTELWENNLKLNKGVVTPVSTPSAPPWGHTPATNIGGHWGDDDSSNNMWNGAPSANTGSANSANWGAAAATAAAAADGQSATNHGNNMWNNPPPSEKHWGNQSSGPAWNEGGGTDNGTSVWNQSVNKPRNVGNWSPVHNPKKEMQPSGWEQPSPPTGRRPMQNFDDGTSLWGNPSRQGKVSHWKDMPPAKPIINSGNGIGSAPCMPPATIGGGMPPTGPGMIRLPTGATVNSKGDMQPSVWNKPSPMNRGNNWNEMPPHRDSPNIGNWGDDSVMHNQIKNVPVTPNTPGGVFGNNWGEQTSPLPYWSSKPKGSSNWADGQVDTSTWLGPSKQGGKPLTRDLIWASKQFRLLIEMGIKKDDAENALRNNNMSFEDSLAELRAGAAMDNNMMDVDNFNARKVRPGNMNDDLPLPEHVLDPSFGSNSYHGSGNFQAPGNFQGISNSQGYKQQPKNSGLNGSNTSNLLNTALGGQQSNMGSISNFTPNFVHKLLQQQQQLQSFASNTVPQNVLGNQGARVGQNNFPSAAQLRHLVQQIQMAVQAGHLNPQILNQPLAPQTLQLLYQLLQQIKVLHQLQQHQLYPNPHLPKPVPGAPNNSSGLQLNVQITQTKQRIMNLQNQIAAQQAVFLKNQVQQQTTHQPLHTAAPDIFKQNIESVPALQQDFRDLSLKDLQTQSRLNQWKLPSYEKEDNSLCSSVSQSSGISSNNNSFNNDFSRAPGPLPSKTSSASSALPNPGPNLHPLLSQGDSAWSSLSRNQGDSGWPVSSGANDSSSNNGVSDTSITSSAQSTGNGIQTTSENKEQSPTPPSSGPSTSSASHTSYTDLVPEFEPGKPWKGTPLKNVEDDPHITPGSITRSPLSLNTIKDSDLFNWSPKSSPATTGNDTAGTLTSSTWVFTPTAAVANSSSGSSKTGNAKSNWGDLSSGSDLWNTPVVNKTRCPPPGIPGQGWDRGYNSSFLLLRNLTPQIDGSTLKTLCMQHGPLQLFHLSLNHGIALVRYNSREEAAKAQLSLNNCVLGNTTILSDIPSDVEIPQYLNILTNQTAGGNMGWPSTQQGGNSSNYRGNGSTYSYAGSSSNAMNSGKLGSSAWNENMNMTTSQLWSFSNSPSALWGNSQSINDDQSANSTLNSFLPGDLLGGEPNVI